MATLNIKSLPEAVARKLRRRAKEAHRSVTQEVIHILERATEEGPRRSLLELRGLGKEEWGATDAATHVARERDAWE